MVEPRLRGHAVLLRAHRVSQPDDRPRWIHGRGRVIRDESGRRCACSGRRRTSRIASASTSSATRSSPLCHTSSNAADGNPRLLVTLEEKGDRLDEETRSEMVRNLAQQSRKLDRLLSDLLDIDRLRRGFVPPNFHETDVGQLVEHVATAFSPGSQPSRFTPTMSAGRCAESGADRRQPDRERRQPHAGGHRDLGPRRGEQRWRADQGGRQRARRRRDRPGRSSTSSRAERE